MIILYKAMAAAGATTLAAKADAEGAPAASGEAGGGGDSGEKKAGDAGDAAAEEAGVVAVAPPDNLDDLSTIAKFTCTSGGTV